MTALRRALDQMPYGLLLIACATIGLAPFVPEPHVWEKLKMLVAGALVRPIDIFDLMLHGLPWAIAALKLVTARRAA